jgi:hypothetical protein
MDEILVNNCNSTSRLIWLDVSQAAVFTASPHTPATSASTAKPGIPGGGREERKPSYGGHEADEYGKPVKK